MDKKKAKTATEIIDEVKEEICMHYCKYTNDCYESLDQEEVDAKCEECPLNKL